MEQTSRAEFHPTGNKRNRPNRGVQVAREILAPPRWPAYPPQMHPLNVIPEPTDRDFQNARFRQEIAQRQQAAWDECLRLADKALGRGWEPWMKLTLVDADHGRTGDETSVAVGYKVRKGEGDAREVRYLGLGPDGQVIAAEQYEDVFGSLLTELHPTKTIEVKG